MKNECLAEKTDTQAAADDPEDLFWQVAQRKTSQFAFSAKVFPYHGNPLEGRFRTQSWPLDHRKIDSMDLDALPMGSFISLYHL